MRAVRNKGNGGGNGGRDEWEKVKMRVATDKRGRREGVEERKKGGVKVRKVEGRGEKVRCEKVAMMGSDSGNEEETEGERVNEAATRVEKKEWVLM